VGATVEAAVALEHLSLSGALESLITQNDFLSIQQDNRAQLGLVQLLAPDKLKQSWLLRKFRPCLSLLLVIHSQNHVIRSDSEIIHPSILHPIYSRLPRVFVPRNFHIGRNSCKCARNPELSLKSSPEGTPKKSEMKLLKQADEAGCDWQTSKATGLTKAVGVAVLQLATLTSLTSCQVSGPSPLQRDFRLQRMMRWSLPAREKDQL